MQNSLKLQIDITLPQGQLRMTTNVDPASPMATQQRLSQGVALYASKGDADDWPGVDRKTWSLWMPVKIPKVVRSFAEAGDSAELIFDNTVCSYKQQVGGRDYFFESCNRWQWQPFQTVRVKSLTLRVGEGSAGVVLSSE